MNKKCYFVEKNFFILLKSTTLQIVNFSLVLIGKTNLILFFILYLDWRTYYLFFIGLFLSVCSWAQNPHVGDPLSWNLNNDIESITPVIYLPEPDVDFLLDMDALTNQDKSKPFHFAAPISVPVAITLESNFGIWNTLDNGDRIWTIAFDVPGAIGLGVVFGDFHLPKDAKLFIYNQAHNDKLGAFTHLDNNVGNVLSTLPIQGEHIIIEYFEPYERTGDGRLSLDVINYQYRDFNGFLDNSCTLNVKCSSKADANQLGAVVKIITNDGTKLGTGVLVGSEGEDNISYVITSSSLNRGNHDLWQFVFNDYSVACESEEISSHLTTVVGAQVVATSSENGLMLLKLNNMPSAEWNIYFSGWNRKTDVGNEAFCIHYSFGGLSQFAANSSIDFDQETVSFLSSNWEEGNIGDGSVGAPLFDSQGLLVGFFSHGTSICSSDEEEGTDVFIAFEAIWNDFKQFLDPSDSDPVFSNGKLPPVISPEYIEKNDKSIVVFPIPAQDFIHVSVDDVSNSNPILKLEMIDIQGRVVFSYNLLDKSQQLIDISSLPKGWYSLAFYSRDEVIRKAILIN